MPWIDKPGIQTDEALFASGIYPPFDPQFGISILKHDYPLMVMSYVGALKSRLWAVIFTFWPPSPASVRVPAALLGALSIWLMYRLMSRTLGTRAALVAAVLTATDPIYVLYSRWDHGPVVIQHLCLQGAMLSLVRFHQERRTAWLMGGFFALGLGLWEKALFASLISGLSVAALCVFWRQIRSLSTPRNVAFAVAALALGALPLIVYNARQDLATFRSNTVWSTAGFGQKTRLLERTLDGSALFGSIMREAWDGPMREPGTLAQRAVVSVATATGMPHSSAMGFQKWLLNERNCAVPLLTKAFGAILMKSNWKNLG